MMIKIMAEDFLYYDKEITLLKSCHFHFNMQINSRIIIDSYNIKNECEFIFHRQFNLPVMESEWKIIMLH